MRPKRYKLEKIQFTSGAEKVVSASRGYDWLELALHVFHTWERDLKKGGALVLTERGNTVLAVYL